MKRTPMQFFEALSSIPRVSGNEKAAADFVEQLARANGYPVRRDAMHNLIVIRPASPGCEKADSLILQGHLDMVGSAKPGVIHDFEKDPIRLVRDGDILRADGTTLGADDGVAVAYMLAILDDPDIAAPRLECVFTVQEETGLVGAQALEFSGLRATRMLNLDAGPEGVLLVSCAGGCRLEITGNVTCEPVQGRVWQIRIDGLRGGSATAAIQNHQANALLLAAQTAQTLCAQGGRLVCLEGGEKETLCPSSAALKMIFPGDPSPALEALEQTLSARWGSTDPGIRLSWQEAAATQMPDQASAGALIRLLCSLPWGAISMSPDFPGLLETSANIGVCRTGAKGFRIGLSIRSASDDRKRSVLEQIDRLCASAGAAVQITGDYPGWAYDPVSPLRESCIAVFEQQYGRKPSVEGVHAGLECGVFKAAMPQLDIVATGPLYRQMHTPDEWLDVASFDRTYCFLLALLKKLSSERGQ